MLIFGAAGDLTKRLVVPALYNLAHTKILPENFALIGVDHGQGTVESWRDHLYKGLKGFVGNVATEFNLGQIDEAAWQRLAEKMSYIQGDIDDPNTYVRLGKHLEDAAQKHQTAGNVIFPRSPIGSSARSWTSWARASWSRNLSRAVSPSSGVGS